MNSPTPTQTMPLRLDSLREFAAQPLMSSPERTPSFPRSWTRKPLSCLWRGLPVIIEGETRPWTRGAAPSIDATQPPSLHEWAPLESLRTALCVEPRGGRLHVFLPPVATTADFLDLIAGVENAVRELEPGNIPSARGSGEPGLPLHARSEKELSAF